MSYDADTIAGLDVSTPPEGDTKAGDVGPAIREIKTALKGDFTLQFYKTVTLIATAAGTAINIFADNDMPSGKKVYLHGFFAKVNGGTAWTGITNVKIQDTNSTAKDFFTIAMAALIGNAELRPGVTNVVSESAYILGSGGTVTKGLQVKADTDGNAASDLVLTAYGVII